MGDLPYLELLSRQYKTRAEKSKHWIDYIKAHGLANACAVLDSSGARQRLVYDVEGSWYNGKHPLTFDEHQSMTSQHKLILQDFRSKTEADFDLLAMKQEVFDIDNIFSDANLSKAQSFAFDVFSQSKACSDRFVQVSRNILEKSVGIVTRSGMVAPCAFAVIGLGSVARGEATPYSDLEYAFLVDHDEKHKYFFKVAIDSYFRMSNLGETPLKCFNIGEISTDDNSGLAMFTGTTVGYRFDGVGSSSGAIPTGNDEGSECLIRTPEGMMTAYKVSITEPAGNVIGDLSNLLFASTLIFANDGGFAVYERFRAQQRDYETTKVVHNKVAKRKRLVTLSQDIERYNFLPEFTAVGPPDNSNLQVKDDIFRFPTILAADLGIFMGLDICYPWETYHKLLQMGVLSSDNYTYVVILLALSIYIRTHAYLYMHAQSERLSVYSSSTGGSSDRYHVSQKLFVTLGCLLVPIKTSLKSSLLKQRESSDVDAEYIARSLMNDLQVSKSDYMLTVEVLYFIGDSNAALNFLYRTVGESNVNNCDEFLKTIRQTYARESKLEKKYMTLCFQLLQSTNRYRHALEYVNWLVANETSASGMVKWKIYSADFMNRTKNYKSAETLLQQSLELLKETNGVDHNLAVYVLKKLAVSDVTPENDLELCELTAVIYGKFAETHRYMKNFSQALEACQTALYLMECLVNKSERVAYQVAYATSFYDLGKLFGDVSDYKNSLLSLTKALDKLSAIYGENTNHPDIAKIYNGIGDVHATMGNYNISLVHHTKAIYMLKAVFGEDTNHTAIAAAYYSLARVHQLAEEYPVALNHLTASLAMNMAIHEEENHPEIANCYNALGELYSVMGEYTKSLDYHNRSLQMRNVQGEDSNHLDLISRYRNVGSVYFRMGDYKASLTYYKQSLDMASAEYGRTCNHPSIAALYENVAEVYYAMNDYADSLKYYQKSQEMLTALHGTDSIMTLESVETNIKKVLSSLGESQEHDASASFGIILNQRFDSAISLEGDTSQAVDEDKDYLLGLIDSLSVQLEISEKERTEALQNVDQLQENLRVKDDRLLMLQKIQEVRAQEERSKAKQEFWIAAKDEELRLSVIGSLYGKSRPAGYRTFGMNFILDKGGEADTMTPETQTWRARTQFDSAELSRFREDRYGLKGVQTIEDLIAEFKEDKAKITNQEEQIKELEMSLQLERVRLSKGDPDSSKGPSQGSHYHDGITDGDGPTTATTAMGLHDYSIENVDPQESLFDLIDPSCVDPDFQPIPDRLIEIVSDLCLTNSVTSAVSLQAPDDWRKILVIGVNAESIQSKLNEVLGEEFQQFCVHTQNIDGPLHTNPLTGQSRILTVEQKSPTRLYASSWQSDESFATCELLVIAREKNKEIPSQKKAVYAVVPAHLILTTDQNLEGATAKSRIAFTRNAVEQETTNRRYICTIHVDQPKRIIELKYPPLLCYRHWYRNSLQCPYDNPNCHINGQRPHCPHIFANDMALLHLDHDSARTLQGQLNAIQSQQPLVAITDKAHLGILRNQKIAVGDATGVITSCPITLDTRSEHDGQTYGHYLPFKLTSEKPDGVKHKLVGGDCGRIVYLITRRGIRRPLGMFVGAFTLNEENLDVFGPTYQAIVLYQAFKDIEGDYPHHVEDIRLFQLSEEA